MAKEQKKEIKACSNCTFMELKSHEDGIPRFRVWTFKLYLYGIEITDKFYSWFDTLVQIVPVWNWNFCPIFKININLSSNCTFMELKYWLSGSQEGGSEVLIVPLWNWNAHRREYRSSMLSGSNCTFMELKYNPRVWSPWPRKF